MVKKQDRARFYVSYNCFCTLYFLMKLLLVKLKNLRTSALLNLNYGTTEIKNIKVAKMMELIKTFDQYPHKWSFFQLHNPSPFLLGGNRVSENAVLVKWVISFCLGGEFYLEE